MIPIISIFTKNDEINELCDELKENLKKFGKYNNIYRSILYDYSVFCKKN